MREAHYVPFAVGEAIAPEPEADEPDTAADAAIAEEVNRVRKRNGRMARVSVEVADRAIFSEVLRLMSGDVDECIKFV